MPIHRIRAAICSQRDRWGVFRRPLSHARAKNTPLYESTPRTRQQPAAIRRIPGRFGNASAPSPTKANRIPRAKLFSRGELRARIADDSKFGQARVRSLFRIWHNHDQQSSWSFSANFLELLEWTDGCVDSNWLSASSPLEPHSRTACLPIGYSSGANASSTLPGIPPVRG
jgi:hypothetical protein